MRWWRERLLLLPTLAALVPLSNATEITSTFTTIVPTTTVVTSSSAVAGCTVASSMQIACSDGYYNTWGAVWQETCAASYSGGSLILSSSGLSLRACVSACSVRSVCSAAFFAGNVCYLLQGDVTITPGGPYQAAMRYAPSASPCVSTWLVTETDTVTSTGEVVYTVTPSSTPVTPSSAPMSPSSTPSSTSLIRSLTTASSSTSSPVSSPVRSSSTRLTSTSIISSVSPGSSSVIPSGSSSIPFSASSSTPLSGSSITSSVLISSSTPPPSLPPSFSSSSSSFLSLPTSPSPSAPSASSGESASAPNASVTQPATSANALAATTVAPSGLSPSTQSSEQSSGSTPSTSTFTVTTTKVYTVTSCAPTITNCPVNQQTTYLTTETITYVTTACPGDAQATATQATGLSTNISHTSVVQTANPQHTTAQVVSASSAQGTETGVPPPHMTTSTTYVTEIDVVTTCPPSVHNCPIGQRSTYTMTKTVATYTTTYMIAVVNSTQVALVQPVVVPTLSLAHPHVPSNTPTGDTNYTLPHAPSSSAWEADVASSGSTQAATHATTMNTVSGITTYSVTTSAPGSLFTGDAPKMRRFSPLFTVVAVLSTLLFC